MTTRLSAFHGMRRRPRVVAALSDPRHLQADARAAVRAGADLIEIRADVFPRAFLHPEPLRALLAKVRRAVKKPLIITLRARAEGGRMPRHFQEQDRLNLFRAALSNADVADVELSANDINHHVVFEAHKRGRAVILSYHDFRRTPSDKALAALVRKVKRLEGDVLKVAATPRRAWDVARFMEFCRRTPFKRRVFLPMGPKGRESRKNGFEYGSCLTYGYVRRPTAPGQFSVRELAKAVRAKPL